MTSVGESVGGALLRLDGVHQHPRAERHLVRCTSSKPGGIAMGRRPMKVGSELRKVHPAFGRLPPAVAQIACRRVSRRAGQGGRSSLASTSPPPARRKE